MAQLFFCSDMARRDASNRWIERVEGWCLCTAPVVSWLVEDGTGLRHLPRGFARPDLAAVYPQAHDPAHGGFRFSPHLAADEPARLFVELENGNAREWHTVPVNLESRVIEAFELNEQTRVSPEDESRLRGLPINQLEERVRGALRAKPGITLRLDIINKCNLRCVMCHFSDDAVFKRPVRQLTADEFKRLFDEIGPDVRDVALSCGDEPLVSKFLPEILRYLATEHPHVAVEFCTNATLMRAPIRQTIIETGVARLLFSIDAVSKPLLEKIRAGARYEQVIGNILALRDLRDRLGLSWPMFQFNYVMMVRNIHEAPAFVEMAKRMGGAGIDFRHVVPIPPYFEPDQLLDLQPARFNYYREQILSEAARHGIHVDVPTPFPNAGSWQPENEPVASLDDFHAVQPDANLETEAQPARSIASRAVTWEGSAAEEFSSTFCNRPFSEVMVRDQDEVLPCPWHAKPLGRLSDGRTLSEIFFGEEFARLRSNMLRPEGDPGCARCPIKSGHLPTGDSS